jgi:hypothetical protein
MGPLAPFLFDSITNRLELLFCKDIKIFFYDI